MSHATWFYMKYVSSLSCIFQVCSKPTKQDENDNQAIVKAQQAHDFEFNYKNIVERMRLSNFETIQHEYNNNVNYNDFKDEREILINSQGQERNIEQLEIQAANIDMRLRDKLFTKLIVQSNEELPDLEEIEQQIDTQRSTKNLVNRFKTKHVPVASDPNPVNTESPLDDEQDN